MELTTARSFAQLLRQHRIPQMFRRSTSILPSLVDTLLELDDNATWLDVLRNVGLSTRPTSAGKSKQRCADMLHRALSMIDLEQIPAAVRVRARIRAQRQFNSALILSACSFNSAVVDVLDTTSEITARFDMPLPSLMVEEWRLRYISIEDRSDFQERVDQVVRIERAVIHESEINRLNQSMISLLHRYHANAELAEIEMQEILTRASNIHEQADTFLTRNALWKMKIRYGMVVGDYELVVQTCEAALRWFEDNPDFRSEYTESEFRSNLLSALLHVRPADLDLKAIDRIFGTIDPSNASRHSELQTYSALLLTNRKFTAAADVIRTCLEVCPADVPDWRKQYWLLYQAYVAEMVTVDAINKDPYWQSVRVSNAVSALRSDVKLLTKNKVLTNSALVILDVIQRLRAHDFSGVINRATELQKYATRYASNKRTSRTARFMRMLATLVAAEFDPVKADKRATAIRTKYAEADSLVRDDAEVIPYDDLWKVVIHHLQSASTKRRT